jgi:hypothetical protein
VSATIDGKKREIAREFTYHDLCGFQGDITQRRAFLADEAAVKGEDTVTDRNHLCRGFKTHLAICAKKQYTVRENLMFRFEFL